MKREKFKNGHQLYYNNCWYNFCIKCLETKFTKICTIEGDANNFSSNHIVTFKNGYFFCEKCEIKPLLGEKYFEEGDINYLEFKSDRLIERFYCGDFLPQKNSRNTKCKLKLPCYMTEDEYLIKTIIT